MRPAFRRYKIGFYLVSFFVSLFMISRCQAQSVVGKWQRDISRLFTIDSASGKEISADPETQKQYIDAITKNGYQEILEMKEDNTYTSTVTAAGKQTSRSGHYTVLGRHLEMSIPLVNGQKTTITIITLSDKAMV
jgi:hypothetical protein